MKTTAASFSFALDSDVLPAAGRLPESDWKEMARRLADDTWRLECSSPAPNLVSRRALGDRTHPLLGAAYLAYAQHRPLCLWPDALWLTILHGLGTHIQLHSEELRERLVGHAGKRTLQICGDEFVPGNPKNPWLKAFDRWSVQLQEHTQGDLVDWLSPEFSTTGPGERAARQVALMRALDAYFEYRMMTLCGIPKVVVEGSYQDWVVLQGRLPRLAEFGLGLWSERLQQIVGHILQAFRQPDLSFWKRLFYHDDSSGRTGLVSGWITQFFPYIEAPQPGGAEKWKPNEILNYDFTTVDRFPPELSVTRFPKGLADTDFTWQVGSTEIPMRLASGLIGVSQRPDKALRPEVGLVILRKS